MSDNILPPIPEPQTPPTPSPPLEPAPIRKTSKWGYVFAVLGVAQVIGVGLFIAFLAGIAGKTGSEFIALFLYVSLVPAVSIVALINIIGLPLYMRKYKPRGFGLIMSIISLMISGTLALYAAYSAYQIYVVVPRVSRQYDEQARQKSQQSAQEFATDNKNSIITQAQATELLNACQLKGFYYTNQTKPEELQGVRLPAAETSSTGVVLVKIDGKPYRISIADRLVPELVPIARAAQVKCGGPQFWHDGDYEQYKDGKWFFQGNVVNDGRPGVTKADALARMQNCQVDYFVGYTGDINIVKDANTKIWLDSAEKSDTGIVISSNPSKTYIFASRSMTAGLQDSARQFRQACYGKKNLYITIDDWIETEYPLGKWTRVKQ